MQLFLYRQFALFSTHSEGAAQNYPRLKAAIRSFIFNNNNLFPLHEKPSLLDLLFKSIIFEANHIEGFFLSPPVMQFLFALRVATDSDFSEKKKNDY